MDELNKDDALRIMIGQKPLKRLAALQHRASFLALFLPCDSFNNNFEGRAKRTSHFSIAQEKNGTFLCAIPPRWKLLPERCFQHISRSTILPLHCPYTELGMS